MLIAAPSDAARPTRRAPCEPTRKAAAKIGASVEMVPSIRPMREGWTKRRIWLRSPCPRQPLMRPAAVLETASLRSVRTASAEATAIARGDPIAVSMTSSP